MPNILLRPILKPINTSVNLHGSKSISNRILLIAAMSTVKSVIYNIPYYSEDVMLMIQALKQLGVDIYTSQIHNNSSVLTITKPEFLNPHANIFCGNSGTTMRFLTGVLATLEGEFYLSGTERMHQRPIADLVQALQTIGSNIQYTDQVGFPPLKIIHFKYNGANKVIVNCNKSSQYLSSLLMALAFLNKPITIEVIDNLISQPYVNLTIELLKKFNYNISNIKNKYFINYSPNIKAVKYYVEPDASSATYFMALGAISGRVLINNLSQSSLQGDVKFANIIEKMGAIVNFHSNSIEIISKNKLYGVTVNMQDMPDAALTLATLAIGAEGSTMIKGIASWRDKETNRMVAMRNELNKLGAQVTTDDDSIYIVPPKHILPNIEIDTYNDHRIAMSFSIISAFKIPIIIKDIQCVNKTFPNYFEIFCQINY